MVTVRSLVDKFKLHNRGKQTRELNEACPVAGVNPEFSPERIMVLAEKDPEALVKSTLIWECLACGLCIEITGGEVQMSRFIREVRKLAHIAGYAGTETHGGMLITVQRMNCDASLKPARTGWITESPEQFDAKMCLKTMKNGYVAKPSKGFDAKTEPEPGRSSWTREPLKVESNRGRYLYWVGGAPFFDAVMPELKPASLDSARAAIFLLNKLGVKPVVLENERFSGHDLLWAGDIKGFRSLAEQNLKNIESSGAETVIVSSPGDYYTLAKDYGEYCRDPHFEVCHITEFLAQHIGMLEFSESGKRVTYHDPCRLGRGMGVYNAPREILRAIPGIELVEMKNMRELSSCCGTSCWINCGRYSKLMQENRLKEAAASGAEVLITTCWECAIHFRCTLRPEAWEQTSMEVEDLTVLAASLLLG